MSIAAQTSFAEALLDRTKSVPRGLRSHTGNEPCKRYGVYRNNVATGLARALAQRFPVTEKIVGEEFFTAMARLFVLDHPPVSPVLLHYGADFADFVNSFAPAASLPYLADIVRLENAQMTACHARDITPAQPDILSRISPGRMSGLVFVFHPAATILRSLYPIVTIWSMNSGERTLGAIKDWDAENALILRPELTVLTRKIAASSARFLIALQRGATLGEAYEEGLETEAEFDLGRNLAELLRSGAVIDIMSEPSLEA